MSATYTGGIGIHLLSDTTLTKVSVSEKLETKTYMNSTGGFGSFATYDPTGELSVEGYGDTCPATIATTTTAPTGFSSGKVIVDTTETTQKNDDFKAFKYTAKLFPNATT
jgi:CubicO group peptidase (beta-lactamase class C family)